MKKDKNWLKNEVEKIWHSGHPRLGEVVEYEGLKNLIEQLEEPMKIPELPQFVDEIIKDSSFTEISEIELVRKIQINATFKRWFYEKFPDASVREMERYLLVAILFDYTIEKEKLYKIMLPTGHMLYESGGESDYPYSYIPSSFTKTTEKHQFTEKKIKAIDERYWAFAEEVTE